MGQKTAAQGSRQKARNNDGRYTKHYECELCGKSVGLDYYSAADCNLTGKGVVLHEECAQKWDAEEL